MAVVSVTALTVKPDRMEDYFDMARKAKALIEKHGGKNFRLLAGVVTGEATGTLTFIDESDDFAGMGAVMDKSFADPELLALLSSLTGTAGPLTGTYQTTIWVDVPL